MPDKRNLYFIDSNGQYRLLKSDVDRYEAGLSIQVFLNEHNFKCYYIRQWPTDEGMKYDVGSHTEFFLWGFKND